MHEKDSGVIAGSNNHATYATHGWFVIDAEIINYAIENLIIEDVLSAQLIYQDTMPAV